MGAISFEPLVESHSNFNGSLGISSDLINFGNNS